MKDETLGVIMARGGSKRVPGKNIKLLGSKPLLAWAIQAIQNSGLTDTVLVSTDSPAIAEVAEHYGAFVPEMRPAELSTDLAVCRNVIQYVVDKFGDGYEHIIVSLPSCPFTRSEDIRGGWSMYCDLANQDGCIVEVAESPTNLELLLQLEGDNRIDIDDKYLIDSWRLPKTYFITGGFYIASKNYMLEHTVYGPRTYAYPTQSSMSVDIDTMRDFEYAEFLVHKQTTKGRCCITS